MKTNKGNTMDLHERAENARRSAQKICDNNNFEEQMITCDEFEAGETASYFRENAGATIEKIVACRHNVEEGILPDPIRQWDADMIVRLLSTQTDIEFEMCYVDTNLSDEETVKAWRDNTLVLAGYMSDAETPTSKIQRQLREAVEAYARAAASYAKHIGSGSVFSWAEILDIFAHPLYRYRSHLSQDEAQRIVALEKAATQRLRLDKIIAELPSYKVAVQRGKVTANRKAKAK